MANFRLKRIALALCLMASLLIGHVSACSCSHHEQVKAAENDCHSHHGSAPAKQIAESGDAVGDICVCRVQQPAPYLASRSISKHLDTNNAVAVTEPVVPDREFVAVTRLNEPTSIFTRELSYLGTLRSLLPARAPPRL